MIRKFTAEGRFECGLDAVVKNKVYAFVAVIGQHNPAALGVAIANEAGYVPIPEHWCYGDDYHEMEEYADELNAAMDLTPKASTIIVASTMGKAVRHGGRRNSR